MKQFEIRVQSGARRVFVDGVEITTVTEVDISLRPGMSSELSVTSVDDEGRATSTAYGLGSSHVVALRTLP